VSDVVIIVQPTLSAAAGDHRVVEQMGAEKEAGEQQLPGAGPAAAAREEITRSSSSGSAEDFYPYGCARLLTFNYKILENFEKYGKTLGFSEQKKLL
jgi:hypothetical protein